MATINSTIISGAGAISALKPVLAGKKRILLVTDANVGKLAATKQIQHLLGENNVEVRIVDSVPAEPSQHDVAQIVDQLAGAQPEMVVGIGGGSVLDVAKLLSVLLHPASPALNALIDGEKPRLRLTSLLIPATAGTGSEATQTPSWLFPSVIPKWGLSPRYCCRISWLCCRN